MKKEEEIASLLSQGIQPAELVRRGYPKSTVYKVARRIAKEAIPISGDPASPVPGAADSVDDPALEADPDILELKKAVRKAQLEWQLAEIRAPIDLEARLARVEEAVNNLIADVWG